MNNTHFEIIKTIEISVLNSLRIINNLERNNLFEIAHQFIKNLNNG